MLKIEFLTFLKKFNGEYFRVHFLLLFERLVFEQLRAHFAKVAFRKDRQRKNERATALIKMRNSSLIKNKWKFLINSSI